jgi:hypothetical protein
MSIDLKRRQDKSGIAAKRHKSANGREKIIAAKERKERKEKKIEYSQQSRVAPRISVSSISGCL